MWAGCCSTDKHCQTHNPNNSQLRIYGKAWQQLQRNVSVAPESFYVLKAKVSTCTDYCLRRVLEVTSCGSVRAQICATKWHFQRIQFLITSCTPDSPYKAPRGILGAFPGVCRLQRLPEAQRIREGRPKQGTEVKYPKRDWKAGDLKDLNISKDSRATGRNKQSLFIIQVLCRDSSKGNIFRGIFLMDYQSCLQETRTSIGFPPGAWPTQDQLPGKLLPADF